MSSDKQEILVDRLKSLVDLWEDINSQRRPPPSSFDELLGFAKALLLELESPECDLKAVCYRIDKILEICSDEEVKLLDNKVEKELGNSRKHIAALLTERNSLKSKLKKELSKIKFDIQTRQSCYCVDLSKDSPTRQTLIGNYSKQLVSERFKQESLLQTANQLIEQILSRRSEYLLKKIEKLRRYLIGEISLHKGKLKILSEDIIGEMYFRGETERDIREIIKMLRDEDMEDLDKLNKLKEQLLGQEEIERAYYILVPELKLDCDGFTIRGVRFYKPGELELSEGNALVLKEGVKEFIKKAKKEVTCSVTVRGTAPGQVEEKAFAEINDAFNMLRFLEPRKLLRNPRERHQLIYLVEYPDGKLAEGVYNDPKQWRQEINNKKREALLELDKDLPLDRSEKELSELERDIRNSLHWFGRAVNSLSEEEKFLKLIIALENILVKGISEPNKKEIIADRAVELASILKDHRKDWEDRLRDIYQLRNHIVHGAFANTRALQRYVDALEWITTGCLDCAVELAKLGSKDLNDMFAKNQELTKERRERKLRESPLQVDKTYPITGQMLKEDGENVGEVECQISFVDDGRFAYYEGTITSFTRKAKLSTADVLSIETTIKGKVVLLKLIKWLGHPLWPFDLLNLARGRGSPVHFRADDIEFKGKHDDPIHT